MEYNKIIAVTGLPGLFELVASKTDGAIVRSLDDQSTKFVSSRKHNFSHLESIEVYTKRDNVNLVDVFQAMKANAGALPDNKDVAAVKAYFETVFPEMDFERVYASDMKKMVKWFEIIDKNNVEFKLPEEVSTEEETSVSDKVVVEEPAKEKKTAKASKESDASSEEAKPKKKAAPKKDSSEEETTEEKPKKTARKKKSEE